MPEMKRVFAPIAAVLALAVAVVSVAGVWDTVRAQQAVTVTLGPGRDASQPGTAVLTARGNQTEVVINIAPGAAGVAQPVHIHEGACPGVGAVKFPLTNIVDGKSTTTVDSPLSGLQTGSFSINAHRSQAEVAVYTACGNIPAAGGAAPPATGSAGPQPSEGNDARWSAAVAAGLVLLAVSGFITVRQIRRTP
jgi:hypothetical protein